MRNRFTKNIVAIFATVVFTILSCNACAKTILVMGDSLSAGYKLKHGEGWVELLQQKLARGKSTHKVVNASVSGETTGGGLARFAKALKRSSPDIVILELGANDGLRGFPVDTMKKNLSTFIKMANNANAKTLLIGMQIPPNYGQRYTTLFSQTFINLAQQHQLPLVPFLLEGVAGLDQFIQKDGLHPRANAQALILQNVLPYLRPMLEEAMLEENHIEADKANASSR